MRILLSTTSYQDTPGPHHTLLAHSGHEIVRARGPLKEDALLALIADGGFDGFLCGDDHMTARVIDAARPRLQVIAKYGIGLDSIDVAYATSQRIPVLFTPGVNHTTVAEHAFGLMIALSKHFWFHLRSTKSGGWQRKTGSELAGTTISVLGMGRIGQEVAIRAQAFAMHVRGYGRSWPLAGTLSRNIERMPTLMDAVQNTDIISLHLNLNEETRHCINAASISRMRPGTMIINTARGGLVDEAAIAEACRSGQLGGYGTDVLDEEPPRGDHPFRDFDNILVTPHIGSRTNESVVRQALRATHNIVNFFSGNPDFIQANKIP